jgi:hypothetical protein
MHLTPFHRVLLVARPSLGTEAQAVPWAGILPFIQAFNRARNRKDKNIQIGRIKEYVTKYRKDHKDDKKGQYGPSDVWGERCQVPFFFGKDGVECRHG